MDTTYSVFKLTFSILLILLTFQNIKAQDECITTLEKAELLFEQGIIEEIPALLNDCLNEGFAPEEKIRAQKLIILSYLFDNNVPQAENVMLRFLGDNPEYQTRQDDPAEFTTLFSSFRTYPFLSAGAFIGGNLSSATLLEQYGPFNPNIDEGNYSIAFPEFQVGAAANIYLTSKLELNIESIYTRNSFEYTNIQYGFAEVFKKETIQKLEFPVSLTYDLPGDKWIPYVRMGSSYGIVLGVNANYEREYVNTGQEVIPPIESGIIDLKDRRGTGVFSAVLGGGVKLKIPKGYMYLDLRYSYGLSRQVNPETRWDQETTFLFYQADGDFQLDYLSFSIGYRYSFFKSTKL